MNSFLPSKFWMITFLLVLTMILAAACSGNIPITSGEPDQSATQNALALQSAQATATQLAMQNEIERLRTEIARVTVVAGESQSQPATATPVPPTATATPVPPTAEPTEIPPTSTPTAIPLPCNAAAFVEDVSVKDGTTFAPGETFVKTWRLQNVGACTWTRDYDLVFYDGDQLGAQAVVRMPGTVEPGELVDVSVEMVAPDKAGSYESDWKLRDASGVLFGIGRKDSPFFVSVRVSVLEAIDPQDFVASYCLAEWTSGAGRVACQGDNGDSRGVIRRIDSPTLESGYVDDEPALMTQPQMITDGILRGKYPAIHVQPNSYFTSVIGCSYKASACDVIFQLDYQIGNGSIQNLASWHEVYDEQFQLVQVDLTPLEGKDVKFILTVQANGSSHQDRALWLAPRIIRK